MSPFSVLLLIPLDEDGYKYVLLASCMFCRFVELGASCDKSAKSWALFLLRVFCRYSAPQTISSDQGTEFVNDVISELTTLFKGTQRFTIGYRPQAYGIAERANREILRHFVLKSSGAWLFLLFNVS